MVDITIFVEGTCSGEPSVATMDSSPGFRESFYTLFTQKLAPLEFNLKIIPFGSVTAAKHILDKIGAQHNHAIILIDLDAPREKREERLNYYNPLYANRVFFMIQEMEAWILSQPDKIYLFSETEKLIRKNPEKKLEDSRFLKNRHPEQISIPSRVLDTLFRQFFDKVKIRQGSIRTTGKRYVKSKDGPKLVALLELENLMKCFDDVQKMVDCVCYNLNK